MSAILALSAWKNSGKDCAAEYLIKKHGFIRVAFADALKELVATQYNIPLNYLHDSEYKEAPLLQYPVETKDGFGSIIHNFMAGEFRSAKGEIPLHMATPDWRTVGHLGYDEVPVFWTPRALAILEGSVKRSASSVYWVQQVINKINVYKGSGQDKFVITDMRYISEAEQLREAFEHELVTCRINRFDTSPSSDPSERNLDRHEFNYVIENRSSLSDFYLEVDNLIDNIRKKI